jgi:hypothetical protein
MTHAPACRLGLGLLWLFAAGGCAGGDKRAAISGRVTLDGQALEAGSISFQPIEGTQGPSAGAVIAKGSFDIPRARGPMAGVYRVEIHAPRQTGKKIAAGSPAPPGTMVDEVVEAVPARYNIQSTLRSEVTAGNNSLNYDLSSR